METKVCLKYCVYDCWFQRKFRGWMQRQQMCRVLLEAFVWKRLVFLKNYWTRIVLKATAQKQSSKQALPKVSLKKELFRSLLRNSGFLTVVSNQLPHTWFNQISDHKHSIYLYEKLSTTLLAQVGNKNTNFKFMKTGWLLFS